jgi:hypothetical protein
MFSLSELETATDHFSEENIIGRGGHSIVYKVYIHWHTASARFGEFCFTLFPMIIIMHIISTYLFSSLHIACGPLLALFSPCIQLDNISVMNSSLNIYFTGCIR